MIPRQFKYKLFGRFKGRKRNHKTFKESYQKYELNLKKKIDIANYNILDIGSGSGENALFLSNLLPNAKIITCELFEDGNINLCNKLKNGNIKNINLYKGNVLEFLDLIDINLTFNEIWILFPDPWPKIRHHKRRLINYSFLLKIYKYLKSESKVMIATDSDSYTQSILLSIYNAQKIYSWENQRLGDWDYNSLNLPKTKFSEKSKKSNRKSMFFKLKKI